jgi:hypothetical protein
VPPLHSNSMSTRSSRVAASAALPPDLQQGCRGVISSSCMVPAARRQQRQLGRPGGRRCAPRQRLPAALGGAAAAGAGAGGVHRSRAGPAVRRRRGIPAARADSPGYHVQPVAGGPVSARRLDRRQRALATRPAAHSAAGQRRPGAERRRQRQLCRPHRRSTARQWARGPLRRWAP